MEICTQICTNTSILVHDEHWGFLKNKKMEMDLRSRLRKSKFLIHRISLYMMTTTEVQNLRAAASGPHYITQCMRKLTSCSKFLLKQHSALYWIQWWWTLMLQMTFIHHELNFMSWRQVHIWELQRQAAMFSFYVIISVEYNHSAEIMKN